MSLEVESRSNVFENVSSQKKWQLANLRNRRYNFQSSKQNIENDQIQDFDSGKQTNKFFLNAENKHFCLSIKERERERDRQIVSLIDHLKSPSHTSTIADTDVFIISFSFTQRAQQFQQHSWSFVWWFPQSLRPVLWDRYRHGKATTNSWSQHTNTFRTKRVQINTKRYMKEFFHSSRVCS